MTRKLRIVQLMPQCPLPAIDGGKVGLMGILRGFDAHGSDVTCVVYDNTSAGSTSLLKAWCNPVVVPISTENSLLRIVGSVFRGRSLYMSKHDGRKVRRYLDGVRTMNVDVVHADHTAMAPVAAWLAEAMGVPWGLRLHNIESTIWKRYSEHYSVLDPRRMYLARQANMLRTEEARWISKADVVFPISEVDCAEALRMAPDSRCVVAPAGVFADEWPEADESKRVPTDVILATTYRWTHNVDGLRWFLQNVWPFVIRSVPTARLRLLGFDPPQWLQSYASMNVVVEGFVPNLRNELHKAAISVVPLFVGSGVRIKIIEALAAGLPVVSTELGAEGIRATVAQGLSIAGTAEEMVAQILELLTNQHVRRARSERGRKHILNTYSWIASTGTMLDAYTDAIRRKRS